MQQQQLNPESILALKSTRTIVVSPRQNVLLYNGTLKSHVAINFPLNASVSNENYDCKLRFLYAIIPNLFKNVQRCEFAFEEPAFGRSTFVIEAGFYSITQLIQLLNTRLKAFFITEYWMAANSGYPKINYDYNQNRCRVIWVGSYLTPVRFEPNHIWQKLGFDFLEPAEWQTIQSVRSPDLSALDHIYIHSPSLSGNTFSSELNGDFLTFIPLSSGYGTTVQYQFGNDFSCMFPASQLAQRIVFEFRDGYGNFIDFDNLDWTIAFEITFIQTQADTHSDFYRVIESLHLLTAPQFNQEEQQELLLSEVLNRDPNTVPFFDFGESLPADANPETE